MNDDDFEFVLEPGRYWWVVNSEVWKRYFKILRAIWPKSTFSVYEREAGPGGEVEFVVLEVKKPMMVSAVIMGAPTAWNEGDTADSLAVFAAPEESWFDFDIEDLKGSVAEWALGVHKVALAAATGAGVSNFIAPKAMEVVEELAEDPGKFLKEAHNRLLWTVGLATAAGVVGLIIYAKVTK